MTLLDINEYDIVNYRKPSMFLIFPNCSMKCNKECGMEVCQNAALLSEKRIETTTESLIQRYINNPLTSAIVCGGMEPFDSWQELLQFIACARIQTQDDIVIYTGYKEEEIERYINILKKYANIIIKFGRFIPNDTSHFDEVLGVNLASTNQYAKKL